MYHQVIPTTSSSEASCGTRITKVTVNCRGLKDGNTKNNILRTTGNDCPSMSVVIQTRGVETHGIHRVGGRKLEAPQLNGLGSFEGT